jgi:hypothetical protein
MSYQLNRTNGTVLTDLIDGQIDTDSTNLTLVGRNYSGYGEFFNENFIKLLENFANTAAPSNPLEGQTWWDTNEQRLKIFNGAQWKAAGGPYVQSTRPQMVAGDLWIDNLNNQLYAYDGTDTILIGPGYTQTQGKSGFETFSILDDQSRSRTVEKFYIAGELVGVFSAVTFTPIFSQEIEELITETNPRGTIFEGFNIVDKVNFKIYGAAESANSLVTGTGEIVTADQFLPSNSNGLTVGTLTIQNSGGLTIGLSQNNVQKVVGPRFYIENQVSDQDLSLRVRSTKYQSLIVDALYIDASEGRVGIFTTDRLPQYTLDVEGDLRITGNLLVEGDTTSVEVATIRVEDKNIELATTGNGTIGDDSAADEGGLIVKSSQGDKTLQWKSASNAWTSNKNIDLDNNNNVYMIGGNPKLSNDSLIGVRFANDLETIGKLNYLDVDDININGATITASPNIGSFSIVSNNGIFVTAGGPITVTDNQKITGVANPTNPQDVATKAYADSQIISETVVFSMDISGLGTGVTLQNNVAQFLNDLYPPAVENNGKMARIHTTQYSGATVENITVTVSQSPDESGMIVKSAISVDSNGTQNESVIQDFVGTSNGSSGNVNLNPIRGMMTYQSNGSNWVHQETITY